MNRIYCCFPGGKHKALTLSYDDGRTQDRRLVEIFNQNGIKGTFHLNSGLFERGDRVMPEEIASLYAGHEVACHTVTHPTIARCPLPEVAQEVLAESDKPSLMRQAERLSPKIIAGFCNENDELAIEVYRRTGYVLGLGLANYASLVDPEAIILTGGISHAGKWLVDPVYESFENHVFGNLKGKVKILTSKLDNRERDVLGASALAWSVPEYSLFK